jgi:hypothetical protein
MTLEYCATRCKRPRCVQTPLKDKNAAESRVERLDRKENPGNRNAKHSKQCAHRIITPGYRTGCCRAPRACGDTRRVLEPPHEI